MEIAFYLTLALLVISLYFLHRKSKQLLAMRADYRQENTHRAGKTDDAGVQDVLEWPAVVEVEKVTDALRPNLYPHQQHKDELHYLNCKEFRAATGRKRLYMPDELGFNHLQWAWSINQIIRWYSEKAVEQDRIKNPCP